MKTRFIKIISIVMCLSLLVGIFAFNAENVNAADLTFTSVQSEEERYDVVYDSSKYDIYWVCREEIVCKSDYGSMWRYLDKGDTLGSATIRMYYLEPKNKVNSCYYAMAGCKVDMDPVKVKGNVVGMSQMAEFGILTPNPDSRVCSPTADTLEIQASKSSYSNGNFKANTTAKFDFASKKWEVGGEIGGGREWGSSSTYTYNTSNVNLTQREKDGQYDSYASWSYDYKSKDGNATWNAYLHSSSDVAGQVVYRLLNSPTKQNRNKNIPSCLYYNIRFGAGDYVNGQVANRLGASTNRDMSVDSDKLSICY